VPSLTAVVNGIEPSLPISNVRTMEELYRMRSVSVLGVVVTVIGAMGAMGLALAIVGLYGLISYTAGRRTKEIGIRSAIGAGPIGRLANGLAARRCAGGRRSCPWTDRQCRRCARSLGGLSRGTRRRRWNGLSDDFRSGAIGARGHSHCSFCSSSSSVTDQSDRRVAL
jgi:hypothetical protein